MTSPASRRSFTPAARYASPIPVRRAHLGDALASEWTKIRSLRSTVWTLGVMALVLLGIGITAAVLVAGVGTAAEPDDSSPITLGFFGVMLGTICVITLGVLTMTSEFGTGMIRTTLTACPSRVRVLTAKAIVYFLLVFVLTSVLTMVVAALQVAIVGNGEMAPPSEGEWFRATVGVSFFLSLLGLLSLAVGTLVRHSAGAVTVMIGLMLLPMALALFMFSESLYDIRMALVEYSLPNQLASFYDTSMNRAGPSAGESLLIMLGLTSLTMAGAYASLNARDV
jgi:ABC-2 type transport system permease protein